MIYAFQSTDVGAPSLSGTAGTALAVLDACLINGYGAVSIASMTRSGSVVTVVTSSAHNFAGLGDAPNPAATVLIGGAAQTDYNGKWRVASVIDALTFTFDIGAATPASPATGTLTVKRAPVGWTKPYTDGAYVSVYQPPVGGAGGLMRVDDAAALYARAIGYESMSDHSTGSNPYPTEAQWSGGQYLYRSTVSGSATRAWVLIADEYMFYLLTYPNTTHSSYAVGNLCFGDFVPHSALDAYYGFISGGYWDSNGSVADPTRWGTGILSSTINTGVGPNWCQRSYTQVAGSKAVGHHAAYQSPATSNRSSLGAQAILAAPNTADSAYYAVPVYITASGEYFRGRTAGMYIPLHNQPYGNKEFARNIAGLEGRELWSVRIGTANGTSLSGGGNLLFDVTGPWR